MYAKMFTMVQIIQEIMLNFSRGKNNQDGNAFKISSILPLTFTCRRDCLCFFSTKQKVI